MPNKASAKKALRRDDRRNQVNRFWKHRYKTFVSKVEDAVKLGDKAIALTAFRVAQPIMHKTASRGIYALNKVSRKISRLAAVIKKLPGEFKP